MELKYEIIKQANKQTSKRNLLVFFMIASIVSCGILPGQLQTNTTPSAPEKSDDIDPRKVLHDRTLVLSGKDLYINSQFIRSLIPASRFSGLYRDGDLSADMQFENETMIDDAAITIYEDSTAEEKEFFIENIDDMTVTLQVVTIADSTDDKVLESIDDFRAINEASDEIYNSLGTEEAALTLETDARSSSDAKVINPKNYRRITKRTRYVNPQEVIIPAARLASYFLMSGDMEELHKLSEIYNVSFDKSKIARAASTINSDLTRSSGAAVKFESKPLKGSVEWFTENGKNGDIVVRHGADVIYGYYDHAGLFSKTRFERPGRNFRSKNNLCILASYPVLKAPIGDRAPERVEYAAYEPLANFTDIEKIAVLRTKADKGESALNRAVSHFYGSDGQKKDYDMWASGFYFPNFGFTTPIYYSITSEYLNTSNASRDAIEKVNYCSFIAWYGYYSGAGIDLDYPMDNSVSGNVIAPDDLFYSTEDLKKKVVVTAKAKGCTALFGFGSVKKTKWVTVKAAASNLMFERKRKDGE